MNPSCSPRLGSPLGSRLRNAASAPRSSASCFWCWSFVVIVRLLWCCVLDCTCVGAHRSRDGALHRLCVCDGVERVVRALSLAVGHDHLKRRFFFSGSGCIAFIAARYRAPRVLHGSRSSSRSSI